jgi:16S rRNA (adenine1518-N6/adenine1519-N6)-dimethyltransferase
MLQKEVAERMVATPGSKAYGPLSIFIQLFSDPSICFYIKPSSFFPSPKVESALVHMMLSQEPKVRIKDEKLFKKVVRGCFGYRRKTLMNALKFADLFLPMDMEQRMGKIGLDPRRRPETLTLEEFVDLVNLLN